MMATNQEKDGENSDADEEPERAMQKLLQEWPFLFMPENIRRHHNRLTGRNIYGEMSKFCENQMNTALYYMTTSSNSNIENMALRIRNEQRGELDTPDQLMMLLLMVLIILRRTVDPLSSVLR